MREPCITTNTPAEVPASGRSDVFTMILYARVGGSTSGIVDATADDGSALPENFRLDPLFANEDVLQAGVLVPQLHGVQVPRRTRPAPVLAHHDGADRSDVFHVDCEHVLRASFEVRFSEEEFVRSALATIAVDRDEDARIRARALHVRRVHDNAVTDHPARG
eukprot:31198-Pelagococcus_subviridis.AAC.50